MDRAHHLALALIFGLAVKPHAAEKPATLEIPAALQPSVPQVPADRNHLTRFFQLLGQSTPEKSKELREATNRLRSGKAVENQVFLEELSRRHQRAVEALTPPLAFRPNDDERVSMEILSFFQAAEVLARQAMLERDHAKADSITGDMLKSSRLLRRARPNQMQWVIARSGWKLAFELLIQDLPCHENPSARLDVIETFFRENRIETAELIECLKMDVQWWARQGGLKELLSQPDSKVMTMWLNPPFNEVPIRDLLKLPYDLDADFQRYFTCVLGVMNGLQQDVPISRWPSFNIPVTGHTIDDYRRRPNGLGDLFHEQSSATLGEGFWSTVLSNDRLLEACLLWLKHECRGGEASEELFKEFLDPVDGKPMGIDLNLRTIRSRGLDTKTDPPDSNAAPAPHGGFYSIGDDVIIVVPELKPRASVKSETR